MRVISGLRRGHRLKAPSGMETRPTEDKVKESLFNILGKISSDARVLDLFAGSGAIGLEFLSRGAKEAVFIDKSNPSISCIKDNIAHTKFEENSIVMKMDSLRYLDKADMLGEKFDYIYVDPPFKEVELFIKILEKIDKKDILSKDGIILVEHVEELILENTELKLIDERSYGGKYISFYRK